MNISLKLSIICVMSAFYVNSEESAPGSLKKKEQPIDINTALSSNCPKMARQAIDDFKRGSVKNKDQLIPFYEKSYSEQFEPIKCFFKNQSSTTLFSEALDFAKENRDYDLARAIIDKIPESYVKTSVPNIKELLLEGIHVDENNEVGAILVSNLMVKVFTTFPSATHSLTNPPRTFCVEWEEKLNYSNKLSLVNIVSGRRNLLLKNLVDAKVLWSSSGRYLAVQWRTFQWMRESDTLGSRKSMHLDSKEPYENIPSRRYQISVIDAQNPDKIFSVEDFLPELARQSTRMEYRIKKWENDCTVLISTSWLEGTKFVHRNFIVTLETDGKFKMCIGKE